MAEDDLYRWKKSSHSDNGSGGCVELALCENGGALVRDSKGDLTVWIPLSHRDFKFLLRYATDYPTSS